MLITEPSIRKLRTTGVRTWLFWFKWALGSPRCLHRKTLRQAGYGFRQDTDAGVYRGGLHGGSFINGFAAGGAAEEEAVCATVQGVLGAGP